MKRVLLAWLSCLLPVACGGDEGFEARAQAPDAGPPPSVAPPAPPPPPARTPKRTVTSKNPFGNVAATHNLLWDGDFEWTTPFAQQAGWVDASIVVSYRAFSQVRPDAACKSGLKCGYLTQSQRVAAIGVSPGAGKKVQASLWTKVPGTNCSEVAATLISCDYLADADVELADADGVPDASGWCHLVGVSEPRARATCLFVEALFDEGEALIDDAVVEAAPDSATPSPGLGVGRERFDSARSRIREALRPAPREPSLAARAYETWTGRAR